MRERIVIVFLTVIIVLALQLLFNKKESSPREIYYDQHGGITTTDWRDQPEWFFVDDENKTVKRYCYGKEC